ncbi:hypothetical protein Tco_1528589, partial [Tanacetum coccineum]
MDLTQVLEGFAWERITTIHSMQKLKVMGNGILQNIMTQLVAKKRKYSCKEGRKVVKNELIVALRGEIHFVKFIINLEEDDIEPGVILRRSFMRLTKGITDFEEGIITIYPDIDPFNDVDSDKASNFEDDWELILDYDKYNKILDEIVMDKLKLDGEIKKEYEEAINRIKGEALKEKEDLGAVELGREEVKPVNQGITMLNHSKAEPMGFLREVRCQTSLNTEDSDSDDEEDYCIKRNNFGAPIYGPKSAGYLNCTDLMDRALAFQE